MAKLREIISHKFFIIAGAIVIVVLGVVQFRQFIARREVIKEIDDLKHQADEIQKSNADMQNLIAYLKTDSYKEKAAREQLKLKKDGEVVYSFASNDTAQSQSENEAINEDKSSNIKKWWNYFFNPNS